MDSCSAWSDGQQRRSWEISERLKLRQPLSRSPSNGSTNCDAASVVTVVLTDSGGKTILISRSLYPSHEIRDQVIATGMERRHAREVPAAHEGRPRAGPYCVAADIFNGIARRIFAR
jgi:hypothetical protein